MLNLGRSAPARSSDGGKPEKNSLPARHPSPSASWTVKASSTMSFCTIYRALVPPCGFELKRLRLGTTFVTNVAKTASARPQVLSSDCRSRYLYWHSLDSRNRQLQWSTCAGSSSLRPRLRTCRSISVPKQWTSVSLEAACLSNQRKSKEGFRTEGWHGRPTSHGLRESGLHRSHPFLPGLARCQRHITGACTLLNTGAFTLSREC